MQRANRKPEVLVIGDLLMDNQYWVQSFPKPGWDEAIFEAAKNPGGSAANTATLLQMHGTSCAFLSRVGEDEEGCLLLSQLAKLGMDLSCMDIQGRTGYTVTIIEPHGERTMLSYRGSDHYTPKLTKIVCDMLRDVKILYLSGYMLQEEAQAAFSVAVAKAAKEMGCLVMLDPAPTIGKVEKNIVTDILAYVDVILPNRGELLVLSGNKDIEESLRMMLKSVPCVVVKMGSEGARMVIGSNLRMVGRAGYCDAGNYTVSAEAVTPIDTTGAGDAFNAGFILAFLQGGDPQAWLGEGTRLAAQTIARKGAVSYFL